MISGSNEQLQQELEYDSTFYKCIAAGGDYFEWD